jgi:hypothetical protein
LECLVACGAQALDVCLIRFDEGPDSPSLAYATRVADNYARIRAAVLAASGTLREVQLALVDTSGRRGGGRHVGRTVAAAHSLAAYRDVIVDISALPRSIFFPLIRALLPSDAPPGATQQGQVMPRNLHVVLHESPTLDASIRDVLTERAEYIPGFAGFVDLEQDRDLPRIWAPVLGEYQEEALRRIEQKITSARDSPEICPVLPFPASDPRRGDRLLVEYQGLLTGWQVELRNVIYAAEDNPFDVYRELCRLYDRYVEALDPLRGAKMIVSAHSSKLLSLGVLLAAVDRPEIAVAHVEATGYMVHGPLPETVDGAVSGVWITGEPFEAV